MTAGFLANFFSLDFVSWWKAASILLTGFFGILGLVCEFKEQSTKRITKWGKLALVGILVSTGSGVYSQMLETAGQNEKRAEDTRQALQLLLGNQRTLNGIERSLSLLDEPTVWAAFSVSCEGDVRPLKVASAEEQRAQTDKRRRFCKAIEPFNNKKNQIDGWPEEVWKLLPRPEGEFGFALLISRQQQAEALENEIDAGEALVPFLGTPEAADWFMYFVTGRSLNSISRVKLDRYSGIFDDERPRIAPVADMRPYKNVNNGKLKSFIDLDDTYLYIAVDGTSYFRPHLIRLTFRNGRTLSFEASAFELLGDKTQYFRAKIKVERSPN
jgi:hypothetical protein